MSDATRRESFEAMDAEVTRESSGHASGAVDDPVETCEMHWIEIECFLDDGTPMAHLPFVLRRSSGAPLRPGLPQVQGQLDENGWARIVRIDNTEDCILEFPDVEEGVVDVRPMYPEFWSEVEGVRASEEED